MVVRPRSRPERPFSRFGLGFKPIQRADAASRTSEATLERLSTVALDRSADQVRVDGHAVDVDMAIDQPSPPAKPVLCRLGQKCPERRG